MSQPRKLSLHALAGLACALAAAGAAAAAAPPQSVTCEVGGKTWFSHAPQGTASVTFVYSTLAAVVGTTAWVGGARHLATPGYVTSDMFVVGTFYDAQGRQLGAAESACG